MYVDELYIKDSTRLEGCSLMLLQVKMKFHAILVILAVAVFLAAEGQSTGGKWQLIFLQR